jgi:Zn-dependent M16 (insulinase) family peptidase
MENYNLVQEKEIKELNGTGKIYIHNKSGARVCVIKNDDINKTFSISFRTPPNDDTGLPHILEHSVLCGSRKFTLNDPFVELAKGSLNTFLNAMTFSDKTMYPIASCNDKDFENLMDVYLDACFYPNIYNEPKILAQEGWHYELEKVEADIKYKGVVYNEMKGVFSSPEQILMRKIQQSLFPDNAYQHESGGDPEYIPDLDFEEFCQFHKTYYHPSNSYIFLYGDIDIEAKLTWIHDNYLKDFEKQPVDSEIKKQNPFDKEKEIIEYYPISSNEGMDNKAFLSKNYVVSHLVDKYEYIALEILQYLLLDAPGASLKKALLEAGIGKDVFGYVDNNILQPTFSVISKYTDEKKKDEFLKIIHDTLTEIVENGLEQKKVEAAINYFEFKIKEADYGRYPKGIIYGMKVMDSWLYDGNPFEHLEYNEAFEHMKKAMTEGYFEQLIKQYFLENNHTTALMLIPNQDLLVEKEKEVTEKLEAYKKSLSQDSLEELVESTKALEIFQSSEPSKEDLMTVPLLEISDIDKEIIKLDYNVNKLNETKVLTHETFTNNIVYVNLVFDTKGIPTELIPYLKLLSNVLGKMDTKNYAYSELSNEINIHTGGIHSDISIYSEAGKVDEFLPRFIISGKCFLEKKEKLFELFSEIILNTVFKDSNRLKEIIDETQSRMSMFLNQSGHITSATRAESYFSKGSLYKDLTGGIGFYRFIESCDNDYETMSAEIIEKLSQLVTMLFKKDNLSIGLTCDENRYEKMKATTGDFIQQLGTGTNRDDSHVLELDKKNEGYKTSGKVQYVAKAGNFINHGYKYSGYLSVLQVIVSLNYLWQNVRVKGGAYGCMAAFKRNGNVYFVSYRDPNLGETMDVYDNMPHFLKDLKMDEREMRKYIIGTISKLDQPLTPSMENDKMLALYLSGVTNEDLQRERDEVLSTTVNDINNLADLVKDVMTDDNVCVIGNESKIESEKERFQEILYLFK